MGGILTLGHGSRGTAASHQGGREGLSIFPEGVSNTSSLEQLAVPCGASCFKENPPHLVMLHYSFSGSDICKAAMPVRALLLPGILYLIISPSFLNMI